LLGKAEVAQQLSPQDFSSGETHRGFTASLYTAQRAVPPCLSLPSQVPCPSSLSLKGHCGEAVED